MSKSDAQCLGIVEPEYVSSTLNFWPIGTEAWGDASVINTDLRDPSLKAALGGLRPSFLYVGGLQAEEVVYWVGNEEILNDKINTKSQTDKASVSDSKMAQSYIIESVMRTALKNSHKAPLTQMNSRENQYIFNNHLKTPAASCTAILAGLLTINI